MAKRVAERFEDDDYFAEPNYDLLTDEELDELYHFGELRSSSRRQKQLRKKSSKKADIHVLDFDDDDWSDADLELEDDFDADELV